MSTLRILNLYAGIGGNRKLWAGDIEVTAVEIDPKVAKIYQDFFPMDQVVVGDAHQYLLDYYREFDFIWTSPPCPTHSRMAISGKNRRCTKYPSMKLYEEIIMLNQFHKGLHVVENVIPYYKPLIEPQFLDRHCFWANFKISKIEIPARKSLLHSSKEDLCTWLGFENFENVYLDGNHCERQVLRNCVHPEVGLHILNCALNLIDESKINQVGLFNI